MEISSENIQEASEIPTAPIRKWFLVSIVIMIFLLGIPISIYLIPHNVKQPIHTTFRNISTINYTKAVLSSDKKTLFFTDITSYKTTTIAMRSYMPFDIGYWNVEHYNGIFSPDKKSLLFLRMHNIWKMDLQTKAVTQLSTLGRDASRQTWGIDAEFPKWSPDGKLIYYTVDAFAPEGTINSPGTDIKQGTWIMDNTGKHQQYLSIIQNPISWMPDNKTIIFADLPYDNSDTKSFNIETKKLTVFLKGVRIRTMNWSLNGEKAVYTKNDLSSSYLISKTGKILATLLHYDTDPSQNVFHTFLLSPDGNYILITKDQGNASDVLLYNTQTDETTQLPITFSEDTKPFWSQDSNTIIYGKTTQKPGDLFTYTISSHKEEQITYTSTIDPSSIDY